MPIGTIYKALSGFFYIDFDNRIIQCNAKGKFRHEGETPLVGDRVDFTIVNENCGIINEVLPRKNSFIRPAVANVDTFVFIASAAKPVTDPFLIDRVSVIAESANCEFILCINKTDLEKAQEINNIYLNSCIKTINTNIFDIDSIDDLVNNLKGKISVFTGNSGVGKSSILNLIIPGLQIETNDISNKLGRGKHTTRHIELYRYDKDTLIADTPGFASFDVKMIDDISANDLQYNFIDFKKYIGKCRFNDCMHVSEPGCCVLNAVENGLISKSRHDSYVKLLKAINSNQSWD